MENREHIDRLYQEKFKDFEVAPDSKVWKNIEASLQKKKRRVLPFWWISGGAVATLLIGLLLYPFSSGEKPSTIQKEEIIITETDDFKEQTPINKIKTEEIQTPKNIQNTDKVVTKSTNQKQIKESFKNKIQPTEKIEEATIFNNVVVSSAQEIKSPKSMKNTEVVKSERLKSIEKNKTNNTIEEINKAVVAENTNKKDAPIKPKKTTQKVTENLVAINPENEEKTEKKSINKKWSVTPSVAFLNSGTFNKSSPISANLSNVSGDNSYSYGVKMAYKINKKWELQTGIHLQKLQYNTSDVRIASASTNNSNIDFNSAQLSFFNANSSQNIALDVVNNTLANQAILNQTYGYVEVPIEVKYTFFESSKLSTQIVTGFSSLFLNQNEISANATNFSQTLGEANNLNSLNFSGNIGLDINYQLLEKLQLNINPMFKQQFNTFSKNANGFKPYSIGIYTGIKYEF